MTGWIQHSRLNNKFILLRDKTGHVQLIADRIDEDAFKPLKNANLESSICIEGTVIPRPEGQANSKIATGLIEVQVDSVKVVNPARSNLPFYIKPFNQANEALRLKYRYLDLRHIWMQNNLKMRSDITLKMRNFLADNGFTEVETPTLFRRTPGGAREFIVPTHVEGQFYSLVQSPQQFKQLLMAGGLGKYFQIARCYRDEGSRPDRQPEFTQVDIELAFSNCERIQTLIEELLRSCWPDSRAIPSEPFPRLTYQDCMEKYGTDKPDLRFDNQIQHVSPSIMALGFEKSQFAEEISKSSGRAIEKLVKNQFPGVIVSYFEKTIENTVICSASKFLPADARLSGDLGVITVSEDKNASLSALGKVRQIMSENYLVTKENDLKFCWVVDFPLFLPKENGQSGLQSAHHPFTRPHDEDIDLLETEPEKIRGQHYDLVLNGQEIGGGSIRIHESHVQKLVLEEILKEDTTELDHMIEALNSGCPPHGGIALGLDRLVAIICKARSIRDVIAFPKTTGGKDLMSGSPAEIKKEDKDFYHIK